MNADKSNMRQSILDFPKQFDIGCNASKKSGEEYAQKKFENIIVAGMGGSALPGEILKNVALDIGLKLPVKIQRNYMLPEFSYVKNESTLICVISYSGNTEETLHIYKEAVEKNFSIIAITSGGELQKLAEENNTPLAVIPGGIQPRLALGYQFSALVCMLSNVGIIDGQEEEIKKLSQSIDPKSFEEEAKKIAKDLEGKTPLIYSSQKYWAIAYILKIQMNENAKIHAFYNLFPELNHNEMVGFEASSPERFSVIMIKSADDNKHIQKRMAITQEIIEQRGYAVHSIDIPYETIYNRTFNTLLKGLWISYYLAINANLDPNPVQIVEELKKKLK